MHDLGELGPGKIYFPFVMKNTGNTAKFSSVLRFDNSTVSRLIS